MSAITKAEITDPRSVVEAVVTTVRDGILTGVYKPGEHLVERRLSDSLGVSHIAIREAFAKLDKEGLVVRVPRRGTFVAEPSADLIEDVTRVRIALEKLAAGLVVERWDDSAGQRMNTIVDEMYAAAEAADPAGFYEADRDFHMALWEIAGSPILLEVASLLRGQISVFLRVATQEHGVEALVGAADVHKRWIEAIAAGDLSKVLGEIEADISATADQILAHL